MEYTTIHRTYCSVISQLLLIQYFINLLSESHQIGPQRLKFSQSRVVHTAYKEMNNWITSNIIQQWVNTQYTYHALVWYIPQNKGTGRIYHRPHQFTPHWNTVKPSLGCFGGRSLTTSLLITLRASFNDKSSVISAFYLLILLPFIWQFIGWICCF